MISTTLIYSFLFLLTARVTGFALTYQVHFRGITMMAQKRDDAEYLARLQEAAKDPEAFERLVMGKDEELEAEPVKTSNGGGYQRIEEWDKEHTQNLSWEEKVQFDGQRFGNQVNQNEILRKNLKSF
mmetsp:Transcript_8636/g.13314  ORF Transcript_8636/g.13314 Transcript_8636/m.13314 type:complete len:127 (-) Transcript_8636:1620-2000(-)